MINFKKILHSRYKLAFIVSFLILIVIAIILSLRKDNFDNYPKELSSKSKNTESEEAIVVPKPPPIRKFKFSDFVYEDINNLTEYVFTMLLKYQRLFDYFAFNNTIETNQLMYQLEQEHNEVASVARKYKFNPSGIENILYGYENLIKELCTYYKLDWRLILAIIHQESLFNPNAISRAGAFGLMQIMPKTGLSLQGILKLENTKDPENNLSAGIYYYATLVANFEFAGTDKYKFALASYNAGIGRVIDAMTITYYFGKDYKKWDEVKEYLPYLSSNNDSLHKIIWPEYGRPKYGILNNWKEPYLYVEYVWYYYEQYKKYFPSNLPEEKPRKKRKQK